MKKQQKLQSIIREVLNLIINFFKPYGLKDEIFKIPKELRTAGFKARFFGLTITIVDIVFAFLLKTTNTMIESGHILLGISLFILYYTKMPMRQVFYLVQDSMKQKLILISQDTLLLRVGKIVGKVADKVLKKDVSTNLYRTMSNEEILNSTKKYVDTLWARNGDYIFNVLKMISVIVMLIVAIITNTIIPQTIFISIIIGFSVFNFVVYAYNGISQRNNYKKVKEYRNKKSIIANDLLRVPAIVEEDIEMRLDGLQESMTSEQKNSMKFQREKNLSGLLCNTGEIFCQYGIILVYLGNIEWDSINLGTITEINATIAIFEMAFMQIRHIVDILNKDRERMITLEAEEEEIKAILEVYHKEDERVQHPKKIENIHINPFSIKYLEESENDKPFTLTSYEPIDINKGEIVILTGVSGSGKSTFMKMLTERIKVEKSTEVPTTTRYLFYDEKLRFGSLSIFEELFCCKENPDLSKMQEILEGLHLWGELERNCLDVWQWLKEKKFNQTLSNGQKQRMILAKILYWMDDEIDVVVCDECTSGLDDKSEEDSADAERILEYIVRYCNRDKTRTVILSTHQKMEGFKEKLKNEYTFRNLHFAKEGEHNLVKEIFSREG